MRKVIYIHPMPKPDVFAQIDEGRPWGQRLKETVSTAVSWLLATIFLAWMTVMICAAVPIVIAFSIMNKVFLMSLSPRLYLMSPSPRRSVKSCCLQEKDGEL